jgi:hypothetical protein
MHAVGHLGNKPSEPPGLPPVFRLLKQVEQVGSGFLSRVICGRGMDDRRRSAHLTRRARLRASPQPIGEVPLQICCRYSK